MFRYHSYLKTLCHSSQQILARNFSANALPKLPLADWWLKVAYLEFRAPVVYFSSPGLVFPKQTFKNADDRIRYASQVVAAAVDFKLSIDQNKIKQEMYGKAPLDMSQYKKVFGTCRIPNKPGDKLEYYPNSRHIVVMHKNHAFKLDVVTAEGTAVDSKQLAQSFKRILELSRKPAEPIGILTSNDRDSWSDAYALLTGNAENVRSLQAIAESLFVLCFDDKYRPGDQRADCGRDPDRDMNDCGQLCMHGGGSSHNGGNRWYDKTIQFIIGEEGHVGLTYEHSPAEGQPIAVMMDHIVKHLAASKTDDCSGAGGDSSAAGDLQELDFCTSNDVKEHIKKASANLDALVEDCDTACFKFKHFGKNFVKSVKLSPDSFLQMAMQYAFYRARRTLRVGDDTNVRRRPNGDDSLVLGRVDRVCSHHDQRDGVACRKGARAQGGRRRHLLGLKLIAQENGIPLPDIYTDAGYVRSLNMRISTSQVASKADGFMVYGPLVKDGYACCYNPLDNEVNFGITAHASNPTSSANNFRVYLEQCLLDMQNIFVSHAKL
ncbi:hypothetical protein LSTR_LSTR008602 [Laodelphax striatellus]|uniref:Choline/carnitine acyltransferase domain-containing protein n=1 Tax=Laodelphax striatellus TaxID=195883 RepID=A0A482WR20_LAOST|nr:hypothetical protein LSTR_LSTR008602 [Laodelphax striatellus]